MKETILQFGAGRFIRAFVDRFVHQANEAGQNVGRIVVVQSTPGERAELLNSHPEGFNVLVRGIEDGKTVERVEPVRSIARALVASTEWDHVLKLIESPDLRWIVTNTTEAGFALDPADAKTSAPPRSLPAKLTQLLFHRFQAGLPCVGMLPCELIEHNAARLRELIVTLGRQWGLSDAWVQWVEQNCVWYESLVDCIVTLPPATHPLAAQDPLLICAEPFAFWAIQKAPNEKIPLFSHPALHVVDQVEPYFLRKVRILNGLHSAMARKFIPKGFTTVRQVMENPEAEAWLKGVLDEILPTIADRVKDAPAFARQVWDRFKNPFVEHKLSDIVYKHAEKVAVRLVTTYQEYQARFGKPPVFLAEAIQPFEN